MIKNCVSSRKVKIFNGGIDNKFIPAFEDWICAPIEGYPKEWFFRNHVRTKEFKEILPRLELKHSFHWAAAKYLEKFAFNIGYLSPEFLVETNLGGDAVTGETYLKTPHFMISVGHNLTPQWGSGKLGMKYVLNPSLELSEDDIRFRKEIIPQLTVLYRKVSGIHDYVGMQNQWCDIRYLVRKADRWFLLRKK